MYVQRNELMKQIADVTARVQQRPAGRECLIALKEMSVLCGLLGLDAAQCRDIATYRLAGRATEDLTALMAPSTSGAPEVDPAAVTAAMQPLVARFDMPNATPDAGCNSLPGVSCASDGTEYANEIATTLNSCGALSQFSRRCAFLNVALLASHMASAAAWNSKEREVSAAMLIAQLALHAASSAAAANAPSPLRDILEGAFASFGTAFRPSINIVNNLPTPEVSVKLPPRKTETSVERDGAGNLVRATQLETDA